MKGPCIGSILEQFSKVMHCARICRINIFSVWIGKSWKDLYMSYIALTCSVSGIVESETELKYIQIKVIKLGETVSDY